MCRYLLVIVLLLQLHSYGQIDPKKLDSLARIIDSSANARQSQQESAIKNIDSNYHSQLNKALQNSRNNNFTAEEKRKELKEVRHIILQIVISAVLVISIILMLTQKREKRM